MMALEIRITATGIFVWTAGVGSAAAGSAGRKRSVRVQHGRFICAARFHDLRVPDFRANRIGPDQHTPTQQFRRKRQPRSSLPTFFLLIEIIGSKGVIRVHQRERFLERRSFAAMLF
jgi:hypothetical protein